MKNITLPIVCELFTVWYQKTVKNNPQGNSFWYVLSPDYQDNYFPRWEVTKELLDRYENVYRNYYHNNFNLLALDKLVTEHLENNGYFLD